MTVCRPGSDLPRKGTSAAEDPRSGPEKRFTQDQLVQSLGMGKGGSGYLIDKTLARKLYALVPPDCPLEFIATLVRERSLRGQRNRQPFTEALLPMFFRVDVGEKWAAAKVGFEPVAASSLPKPKVKSVDDLLDEYEKGGRS